MSERRVHVLSDHVANQIAAGEVVERPESVVKELVENSLDAGATRVRIEVEDGGQRSIRVIDDGAGMSPDDAMTALLRHATSKVATVDDLKAIATLGFRGEALPSIRSVSRFSLRTRQHGAAEGVRITAHGADEPAVEPCGGPAGTEIVVDDLFFNVPARRKFLKQASTELQRLRGFVERIALGWPEVHFTLVHQGKVTLDFPADGDLQARILAVLGRDVCRRLHRVELAMGDHRVQGYASEPGFTRPNPNGIYSFINGRFIRDKVVQHAITAAYSPGLERGDYPLAVLFLFVPPEAVDINVHPSKSEVRFVESGAIHGLVSRALRLMLHDAPWGLTSAERRAPLGGDGTSLSFLPLLLGEPESNRGSWVNASGTPQPAGDAPAPGAPAPAWLDGLRDPVGPTRHDDRGATAPVARGGVTTVPPSSSSTGRLSAARPLGCVLGRFYLAELPEGLVVVDIATATVGASVRRLTTGGRSQPLVFPEPVTLSAREQTLAGAEVLSRLGFVVEPFGGADVLLSSVPAGLPTEQPGRLLRAALGALAAGRDSVAAVAQAVAEQVAPIPGDVVDDASLAALLRDLDAAGGASNGLPGVVILPASTIERWTPR